MPTPLVIAVDSSTTSTKAIVVDPAGRVLAQVKAEFKTQAPRVHFYDRTRVTGGAARTARSGRPWPRCRRTMRRA